MKFTRIILLLLIAIVFIQAHPRHRHYSHRAWRPYYYSAWYSSHYDPYYRYYRPYRYYTPLLVTTNTVTTYPKNLVLLTAEIVAEDIVRLNDLMTRGMITERDFKRAKQTLLNRIGMSINPQATEPGPQEIIDQIKTLYQMYRGQLLTEKEYRKQKLKLLAML